MTDPSTSRPYMPGYGIASDTRGMLPWSWAEERLIGARQYWLSTLRPEGLPHLMPVWGVWHHSALWFSTGHRSRKARNLAANPRCMVSTERADEPVVVEGTAHPISDPTQIEAMGKVYAAKYGSFDPDLGQVFRVEPHVVFGFIENEEHFAASATRWEFSPPESVADR